MWKAQKKSMLSLDDEETGDCSSPGPNHSTPIKTRTRIHASKTDRRKDKEGIVTQRTARVTGGNVSSHLRDRVNSTSIVIMKHQSDDDNGHQPSSVRDFKTAVGPECCQPSLHRHITKVMDEKGQSREKSCVGLNVCNNSVCTATFRDRRMDSRQPKFESDGMPYTTMAAHIEQDIIQRQSREIRLLMEELSIRDTELTELATSHQSQVAAWERDRDKLKSMEERIKNYEGDLRNRDSQLKAALDDMRRVNEQKKVNAVKLYETEQEMERLTEQMQENSVLLKEIESQNTNLLGSIKKLVTEKEVLERRQQDFIIVVKEKDKEVKSISTQMNNTKKQFEGLEVKVQVLEEEKANLLTETHAWKQKYCLTKDNCDAMTAQIEVKDENLQKITHQLQESLQQAIALQKALFTSNEREKCKEELIQSLRKQQKRTMQELANFRELYERQSKDTPLFYLSVQDNNLDKSEKKNPVQQEAGDVAREKQNKNMSYHMDRPSFLQHEVRDESSTFLVKTKIGAARDTNSDLLESVDKTKGQNSSEDLTFESGKVGGGDRGGELEAVEGVHSTDVTARPDKSHAVGTSTSDLSLVARQRIKPRSRSLPRVSNMLASPQWSYFSENSQHQSISSSNKQSHLLSERTSRSRSTSPLRTNKHTTSRSTSARVTTVTSSPFNIHCLDTRRRYSRANRRRENGHYYSKHRNVNSRQRNRNLNKPVREKRDVYESSSDISDMSMQERVTCLDELTPADSDGMCYELERDFSKVSLDDLHVSYRASTSKDSSCLALHPSGRLAKSGPRTSSCVKAREWLSKCPLPTDVEEETSRSSQTFVNSNFQEASRGEVVSKREVSAGATFRKDERQRRVVLSPAWRDSSQKNKTQNYNDRCETGSQGVCLMDESEKSLGKAKIDNDKHSYLGDRECSSSNSRDERANFREGGVENSETSRKEAGKASFQKYHETESPSQSVNETFSSSHTQTFPNHPRVHAEGSKHSQSQPMGTQRIAKSPVHLPLVSASVNVLNSSPNVDRRPEMQGRHNDVTSHDDIGNNTLDKQNNAAFSESERMHGSLRNGNVSSSKSVRIRSPDFEEDVDNFVGTGNVQEKHYKGSKHSLKSALKTQKSKYNTSCDDTSFDDNDLSHDERFASERSRSEKDKSLQNMKKHRQDTDNYDSIHPEKQDGSEMLTRPGIRNYYYNEEKSSDSEVSAKNHSKEKSCSGVIPVRGFSRPFMSSKAPCLYNELSHVYFSEQKKRYQLMTPEEHKTMNEEKKSSGAGGEERERNYPENSYNEGQMHKKKEKPHQSKVACNGNNNNNNLDVNDESLGYVPRACGQGEAPYIDSFAVGDESFVGMEKFHAHYNNINNIVKKLEFSSDSLLDNSDSNFLNTSVTKSAQSAVSSSLFESRTRCSSSQDSGCRITPHGSDGERTWVGPRGKFHPQQGVEVYRGSLNDLNQGSFMPTHKENMSDSASTTESNNVSSIADNIEVYSVSLPDFFPDISSVAADSDEDNGQVEEVQAGEPSVNEQMCEVAKGLEENAYTGANNDSMRYCDNLTNVSHPELDQTIRDSAKLCGSFHDDDDEDQKCVSPVKDLQWCSSHNEVQSNASPIKETTPSVQIVNGISNNKDGLQWSNFHNEVQSNVSPIKQTTPSVESVNGISNNRFGKVEASNDDTADDIPKNECHCPESKQGLHFITEPAKVLEPICNTTPSSLEDQRSTTPENSQCLTPLSLIIPPSYGAHKSGQTSDSTSVAETPALAPDLINLHQKKEIIPKVPSEDDTSAKDGSDAFSSRLSTFLDDSSVSEGLNDQVPQTSLLMSPASKLHRLLVESQEMIRCFQKS